MDVDAGGLILGQRQGAVGGGFNSSGAFTGVMDEVGIYPRALSAEEVATQAAVGLFGDSLGDACDPCPLSTDETCAPSTCLDEDGDGYGVVGASACPTGGPADFDCDDAEPGVHPGAVDACDGIDNNCDGRIDQGCLENPETTTYSYNDFNQLTSLTAPAGTTTFSYDGNGNQTTKAEPTGTTTYVWDVRDRLAELITPTETNKFGYDTRNLRVFIDDADGDRRIMLDGVQKYAELDVSDGEQIARFDHDPTRVDALLIPEYS